MNNDELTFGFYEVTEETPKDKLLMFFPNTQDYVEIIGHRIDFQGGFEEFVQYLAKLATYEEENKKLKRSADILDEIKGWLVDNYNYAESRLLKESDAGAFREAYKRVLVQIRRLEEKER